MLALNLYVSRIVINMYDHVGIPVRSVHRVLCHCVNLYASMNIAILFHEETKQYHNF